MTEITIPKTGLVKTGVIGLGAMGLQMARHMAAKGFEVYGADIDQDAMRRASAPTSAGSPARSPESRRKMPAT